jgi:hypothetical protein
VSVSHSEAPDILKTKVGCGELFQLLETWLALASTPAKQKGGMDVTERLVWFLDCLARAIDRANELTAGVLAKEVFWRHLREKSIE